MRRPMIGVRLPSEEVKQTLQFIAQQHGRTLSALVREALEVGLRSCAPAAFDPPTNAAALRLPWDRRPPRKANDFKLVSAPFDEPQDIPKIGAR